MTITIPQALAAARRTRDNFKDTSLFMAPECDPEKEWDRANDRICLMAKFILAEHDDHADPRPKR